MNQEIGLKLNYFLMFSAMNAYIKFGTIWFSQNDMDTSQIGLMVGAITFFQFFFTPISGYIYDRFDNKKQFILKKLFFLGIIPLYCSFFFPNQYILLFLLIIHAISSAGLMSILDNITLTHLGDGKQRYGEFRVWGTIAWALISIINVLLIKYTGFQGVFLLSAIIYFLLAYYINTKDLKQNDQKQFSLSENLQRMKQVMLIEQNMVVFIVLFCIGAGQEVSEKYLFLYLYNDLQADELLLGLTVVFSIIIEIPMLNKSQYFTQKLGIYNMLFFSLLVRAIQLFLFSFLTQQNCYMILFIEPLHGISFSFVKLSNVQIAQENAPPGLETTMLTINDLFYSSFGKGLGMYFGGYIYNIYGGKQMWVIFSFFLSLISIVYYTYNRFYRKELYKKETLI